jgi:hypothetical protein
VINDNLHPLSLRTAADASADVRTDVIQNRVITETDRQIGR